jgi:glycosyltransferase involved in cell wall biosynthesis
VRILVVSDLYPPVAFGGYESETAALVDGLRERHDVLVLTSDRGDAPAVAGLRRELPYVGPKRREALAAPGKAARAAAVMRATLDSFRPDLVYVANSVAIPQAAPLAAAATGVPMAYRLSELFMASSLYVGDRYLRTLLPGQRGLRGAWAHAMRVHNRRLGLQPSAVHRAGISWASNALREHVTLPAAVEPALERTIHPATTQESAFAAIERAPAGRPSVLYLGRMTTAKGIELAYRALAALRREHGIDARLVQVGTAKPEMVAALKALAAELGVADAIDDRGRLETEALSGVLAEASVLVLPTVEWDVFPLVLIEAGLARVPIVAARIGGVPEAVEHEEHALLFEPGDAAACAAALAQALRDPDAAAARAQHAHERMRGLSVARYREESERFVVETAEALS